MAIDTCALNTPRIAAPRPTESRVVPAATPASSTVRMTGDRWESGHEGPKPPPLTELNDWFRAAKLPIPCLSDPAPAVALTQTELRVEVQAVRDQLRLATTPEQLAALASRARGLVVACKRFDSPYVHGKDSLEKQAGLTEREVVTSLFFAQFGRMPAERQGAIFDRIAPTLGELNSFLATSRAARRASPLVPELQDGARGFSAVGDQKVQVKIEEVKIQQREMVAKRHKEQKLKELQEKAAQKTDTDRAYYERKAERAQLAKAVVLGSELKDIVSQLVGRQDDLTVAAQRDLAKVASLTSSHRQLRGRGEWRSADADKHGRQAQGRHEIVAVRADVPLSDEPAIAPTGLTVNHTAKV